MQSTPLQYNLGKEKFKFYQQQLLDEARPLKNWLAFIGIIMFLYDTSEELFFLPKEVVFQHPTKIVIISLAGIGLLCYFISILRFFENNRPKVFKIRLLLIAVGVIAFSCSQALRGYYEIMDKVDVNTRENWYYYAIRLRCEVWVTLLLDVLIPFWYLKLIYPISYWIIQIAAYYDSGLKNPSMVWSYFGFSTAFYVSLWGLKAYHDWKIFLNRVNAEKWDGIHRYVLDKVPDAIAIIDPNSKIIYSNASFKVLCEDNMENLNKKLSNIQKVNLNIITNLNIEKKLPTSKLDHPENFSFEKFQNEDSEVPITFFEILQTIIEPLVDGMTKFDNYSIFSANICPTHSKDMMPHSYEIKISPLLEHGKVILILSDTTQRDLVVSLETVNQYKDKLLATVSHDLRAPINGSLTFIENSIQHETVPTFIKDQFLIPAQRSCKFLLHLVNDILDFSQINAQKLRMNFEALSLVDTIKNCYQLLEMQANYKKIDFSLDLDEKLPLLFTTDHNRLSQIIINLLSNAIKFTFKGGVTLSARVINNEKFSSSANLVEIKVTDTGIGIKEKDQANLFQEFTRIEYEQRNINNRGVGLGLVIANKLAKRLGPKAQNKGINVSSIYGKGSTFWFLLENFKKVSLNLEDSSMNKHIINSHATSLSFKEEDFSFLKIDETLFLNFKSPPNLPYNNDFSPCFQSTKSPCEYSTILSPLRFSLPKKAQFTGKVLVVDDNPLNIMALELLLKQYGVITEACYNGKEAVEKVNHNQTSEGSKTKGEVLEYHKSKKYLTGDYQLIFMDCEMPIMDGFETTKLIINLMQRGEVNQIPIIGCTAHQESEVIKKCLDAGMVAVISKPPQQLELVELLQKYLQIV